MEIVSEAFQREGVELEFTFYPWARAIAGVKNGNFDLLLGAWMTEERSRFLTFSDPFLYNDIKFIKRSDDPFEYQGLASLEGKTIGVIRDYGYDDDFLQATHFIRIENNGLEENLKMLSAHRIDLTLEDERVAQHIINTRTPELINKIAIAEIFLRKPLYIAVSKNHPDRKRIIEAFNRGLLAIKQDGSYQLILEKYNLQ